MKAAATPRRKADPSQDRRDFKVEMTDRNGTLFHVTVFYFILIFYLILLYNSQNVRVVLVVFIKITI